MTNDKNEKSTRTTELVVKTINEVKGILQKERLTITEVAERCGFTRPQLSRYLNFKTNSSLNIFLLLIDVLGYKVEIQSKHTKEDR